MEKKEIIIEGPLKAGKVAVITVAETLLQYEDNNQGAIFFGARKPLCVVIISGAEQRAFSVDGGKMSMKEVIALAPGIERVLQGI